jgi:thiamine-phosphate pyrophosphorylase
MTREERMAAFIAADLYVVITEAFCVELSPIEVLTRALDAGVRLVQLREKHLEDKDLYGRALKFRELTAEKSALLILNDRTDIALAVGADGVHLGQEDLPVEAARQVAPDLIIGCSTHSVQEAKSAQNAGADYVNIGPIFSTQTKSHMSGALGPDAIGAIAQHLAIPWTVMGGIKPSNVDLVLERGARIVAVVTAVTACHDVSAACAAFLEKIKTQ